MTGIRPLAPGRLAQLGDPVTARYVGLGVVALLAVALLYVAVRYGDADRGGSEDDAGGVFSPGPAYGLTGTNDVEEVLMVDGERPGRDDGEADGRAGADGPAADGAANSGSPAADGRTEAGERAATGGRTDPGQREDAAPAREEGADGGRFSHDVRERGEDEWLVEVTDGDRSARFRLSRTGSVLTVDPVASPARRHGTNWVVAAEGYLRDREWAVGTERE